MKQIVLHALLLKLLKQYRCIQVANFMQTFTNLLVNRYKSSSLHNILTEFLCGKELYDPETQLCCGTTVFPLVGGSSTKCCGNDVFDEEVYICCKDQLQPKFAGKFTECCCYESYDTRDSVCCDSVVSLF